MPPSMAPQAFESSLGDPEPPAGLGPALRALWHEAKGEWGAAHGLAQSADGRAGAWVHAYLHRVEGDPGNAAYWYRRAGRPTSDRPLREEWREIVAALLAGDRAYTEFGYSYRSDGHCGAGAPRFNVRVTDGLDEATYAVGCANPSTETNPMNAFWTEKIWTPDKFFFLSGNSAVTLAGNEIVSALIVFDEGTDVGPGEAILDDITFNDLVAGDPATAR